MWIFTKQGFFSLTRTKNDPKKMQLRARSAEDLENVRRMMAWTHHRRARVIETPHADYRFRIIISRADALAVALNLAGDIDYDNFKGRVETIPGQRDKMPALHRVWAEMRQWADDRDRTRSGDKEKPWEWEFEEPQTPTEPEPRVCTGCLTAISEQEIKQARCDNRDYECPHCGYLN